MVAISERELLPRARQFDADALGAIYDQYSPKLFRYAARMLGNADLAEECIAEIFSRFLHALKRGDGPQTYLQAYLYRMAHNWITDYWRAQPPPSVELQDQILRDATGDPWQHLIAQIEHAQVRAAFAGLTPDQRNVLVLKYVEELTNEEIAAALNKPLTAVKALHHRAIGALRRQLLKQELTYEPS